MKIASGLKEAATLANEFQNMRVKIDLRTAHDSYTTWREGQHDDSGPGCCTGFLVGRETANEDAQTDCHGERYW